MGSWITCRCGASIHTNMFTGTHIYQLIEDSDYDAIEDPVDRDKLETLFFKKGTTVYHCRTCGRLLVEWDYKAPPTFYLPEPPVQNDQKDEQGSERSETPAETEGGQSDRDYEARLKELEALAEAEYDQMYDSTYPTGCYARAKDAFYDAIALASKLGREEDVKRLEKRLHHVKEVFRHQFA